MELKLIKKIRKYILLILEPIGVVIMNRVERITRSLRARRRRKTIREINYGLFTRYRRRQQALKRKYKKLRMRHKSKNL